MLIENWAWTYHEKPSLQEDEDDEFDAAAVLASFDDPSSWEPV